MKLAICHDHFAERGGAERLVLYLAKHFNAEIFTSFVCPGRTYQEFLTEVRIHTAPFFVTRLPILKQEVASFWFSNLNLKDKFDLVIASSTLGLYACKRNRPNIWYCHTPTRVLFDLYQYCCERWGIFKRTVLSLWRAWRAPKELEAVKYAERIVANSNNVVKRIRRYYNREATVIYPPVDTSKYRCRDYEDFFLVVQRLEPAKRTSLIVQSFKKMPEKKVVIVGDGPERKMLEGLARGSKNIQLLGSIGERELLDLYARCLAVIYVPMEEDFGLIPVEAMAAGKPCIAADEGGLRETVIHEKTGFLIKPTEENLIRAVRGLTPEKAERMKEDCLKRAKEFDISVFYKKFDELVKQTLGEERG